MVDAATPDTSDYKYQIEIICFFVQHVFMALGEYSHV